MAGPHVGREDVGRIYFIIGQFGFPIGRQTGCFGQRMERRKDRKDLVEHGIAQLNKGSWDIDASSEEQAGKAALAIAISWSVNKSILWAIVHGFFSWFYVIYYAIVR